MVIKVFGTVLARLRNEVGLTQEKLAELAGYDRTLYPYLKGGLDNLQSPLHDPH